MLAYTNSRPSSISNHRREIKNLWLSRHAFVIHVNLHIEKCGRVSPNSNRRSLVSSGICVILSYVVW
ncbi:Bgt-20261 [Blumeria graminis f. sp. tritici]|uniref:Bgt-20261 n=2 Tax=Blumeria graminis f. sp. tritici TaxID=62690 RepID=A0A9X9L9A2_BLUGR|nr:Bgt-20261 [Blumeria graminis f. sp. tritici]